MTQINRQENDPVSILAETTARTGVNFLRYRDFIGRKLARELLDEMGLDAAEEDMDVLEEVMGTGVVNGLVLKWRGETSPAEIDARATVLVSPLPVSLQPGMTTLMKRMVDYGMALSEELANGSDRVRRWSDEFDLLQATDPDHRLWDTE